MVGSDVGGIRHQIQDGVNGFLVESVEEAAERIVHVLKNPSLREQLGSAARETVKRQFLLTRLMEEWLDLVGSFEADFRLRAPSATWGASST